MVICDAESQCLAAKGLGNEAFNAGELDSATEHYETALRHWEEAMKVLPEPKLLEVGQHVRYDLRNFFGVVMSAFPLFDEYFLKDLGSDQAIWVGEPGGDLQRFARKELKAAPRPLIDLRFTIVQNLAAVKLKQEHFNEAVRWADAALVIDGRAPKALMRKGSALLRLNRPGPASDVLATAAEAEPKNGELRRLLREAEARRSPTWVCAAGCCGPWGIVCGGPVVSSMLPQVVAPATKRNSGLSQISPIITPETEACSSCSSSSTRGEEDEEEAPTQAQSVVEAATPAAASGRPTTLFESDPRRSAATDRGVQSSTVFAERADPGPGNAEAAAPPRSAPPCEGQATGLDMRRLQCGGIASVVLAMAVAAWMSSSHGVGVALA